MKNQTIQPLVQPTNPENDTRKTWVKPEMQVLNLQFTNGKDTDGFGGSKSS